MNNERDPNLYFSTPGPFTIDAPQPVSCPMGRIIYAGTKWNSRATYAILMALYTIDYTDGPHFATPEPLGPGGDPYPAMFGKPDEDVLDKLVADTANYWRKREAEIKTVV